MASIVLIKRSASSGAVPSTAQLQLGELAINTYDGRLFTKKNNGIDSIVELVSNSGTWGISITGNADTATKLATTRALTIGNVAKNFDGSAAVSWSLAEIGTVQHWYASRTLPIVVDDCVDIGTVATYAGALNLRVSVSVDSSDFSTSQVYDISSCWAASSGWAVLTPIAGVSNYYGQGVRLEAQQSGGSLLLRIRRVSGTIAGTALVSILNTGSAGTTFTASTTVTSAAPAVTGYFPGSGLQVDRSSATWRGNALLTVAGGTLTGNLTLPVLISNVATGTAPFTVASTTRVANLNAATAGNADTATKLATTRALTIGNTAKNFDGSAAVSWTLAEIGAAAVAQTMYIGTTAVAINRASASLALTGITSIDGSAATLTTARTINGTSFNGSANITTANWGTSRTLTIGVTGKSVDGSGNVSWSLAEIGAVPVEGGLMTGPLEVSGTSGIPAITTDGDIVAGNMYATGAAFTDLTVYGSPTEPYHVPDKEYVDARAAKDNCSAATFNPIPYGVFDALNGTIGIVYTPFTFTSVASASITLPSHLFQTGDAIRLAPSVNDASNYLSVGGNAQNVGNTSNRYVIKVDANTIKIATSVANALAGTATTVAITGTVVVTVNIAAVIDGQTIASNSRVLVKNQDAAYANGVYYMSATTQNAWVLSRAQDADAWSDLVAALVPISQGIVNADSLWICTIGGSGTLNTSNITFKALGTKDVTFGQPSSTSPTISTVGAIQASKFIRDQAAPSTQNSAATLTSAQIAAGILTTAPTGAIALTLPTGTTMEENTLATGEAYDFYIINTSAYAVTINGNTGHTLVGNATIAANTSAHWCIRKSAANTFISYRVS